MDVWPRCGSFLVLKLFWRCLEILVVALEQRLLHFDFVPVLDCVCVWGGVGDA